MKYIKVALTFFLFVAAPAVVLGQHSHSTKETPPPSVITGLGDVNFKVSTKNPEAQKFFNQGLACIYGFNHEESLRAFKHAAELDPQLAMAYWGVALALGSNYNLQADAPQLKEAYASLQRARELSSQSSEREQAYIAALAKRYSNDPDADRQKLAVDYVNAMAEVVKRFPDDLDAATLYAESMMNVRPWKLWTRDGKPAEGTLQLIAVLESVLRRDPNHIGANHYYIHAVEASPNPERAVPSAARLGKLAPKAGHLVHMPSHIYIRTGEYEQAAQANANAIVVDREYINKTGASGVYPMMYYNHNIHFLASVRAMNGRFADSIKAARELEANVKPHLKAMPMLEMFAPYATVTLVRFRKWNDILSTPKPDSELKITTAYWHFARGTAYAGTNEPARAEAELQAFRAVVASVPADAGIGNSAAHDVLKVAELMLAGKIALSRGDEKTGFEILTQAVKAEDAVSYNEPPDWDLPSRELLGGALLRSGDYSKAEKVFRAELVKHPRNGRALFGLAESLKGQKKNTTAKTVEVEFLNAWKTADTKMSIEILSGLPVKREAVSTQLRFDDAKIKTGIRLRYAEQGNVAGPAVIMLHGYGDSWFSFSRVLPLIDKQFQVFVLDQRGFGDSDRPEQNYQMSAFASDVLAFMDEKNLDQVILVGHSMGSFVAQHVAATAPQRVRKLILIGSATKIRNALVLDLEKQIKQLNDPVSPQFVREFQLSTIHQAVPNEFMDAIVDQSLKVPARVWQSVMSGMLATEAHAQLKRISAPTLIVWGDQEKIFSRAEQDALISTIPNAVLKVYPEVGHGPHWERPEQFARDFDEFVNEVSATSRSR